MTQDTRRRRLLLAGNLVLLALLVAVCMHEHYIQRVWKRFTAPPPKPFVYTDNTFFHEVLDFDTLYHGRPAIVMLGNSFTQKMEWHELLNRCDVITRGVNGDVTAGILARAPYATRLRPKIIFVEGGINDIDLRVPPSQILGNLKQAALQVRDAGILPVVTAITHVGEAYPQSDSVNRIITALDDSLSHFAVAQGFDFVNLNPQIAPGGKLNPAFARGDVCHLNAAAYRLWGNAIDSILSRHGI
jgi:lysophospholipase L1-like esterase